MKPVYIVLALGWEYDDQHFTRSETHGGAPHKVFHSFENALRYADKQNIAEYRELDLAEWVQEYDVDAIAIEKHLEANGITIPDSWYDLELDGLDDAALAKAWNLSGINFYEVVEMEIEDASE
jgi:hypothetical protein